ncbi:MAG: substrate-binding domain-containing protein, partial [Nitriliruptorales bacterium]
MAIPRGKRSRSRIVLALVAFAVLLAACGGGADEPTAQEPGGQATEDGAPDDGETIDAGGESPAEGEEIFLDDPYSQQLAAAAETTVDTSQFKKEGPYRIATIVQGPTNGWGTIFDTVMNYELEQSGLIEDQLYVPWDFTTESQANGIDDAISKNVDAILLTSLSRAGLAAPVERAAAAGIPVITCMAGVESGAYTVEVSRNIPAMGYASAKRLAEEIGGQGKVVLLHGIAGVDAAEFWRGGAMAALSEYPDVRVVAEEYGQWSVADATNAMRAVLTSQPQIDGVWVGGLEMGVAVINTFQEAGRDIPFIAGTNALNGFLRLAQENDVEFFVAQFPPAAAKVCVETMFKVLDGEPVQKFIDVKDLMEGTEPFGNEQLDERYVPE